MKQLLLALFTLLPLLTPLEGKAQTMQYSYDSAGNRISRTLIAVSSRSAEKQNDNTFDIPGDKSVVQTQNYSTRGLIDIKIKDFNSDTNCRIEVFTASGINVTSVIPQSETTTIDISNQQRGVYIFAVTIDGKEQIFKITKK